MKRRGSGGTSRSPRRKWCFRITAVLLAPALCLLVLELGLRLVGFGTPPGFFQKIEGREACTGNPHFGRRFFPPGMARPPVAFSLPAQKGPDTYRIFVLGASAARGTPEPAFGFSRILGAMLQSRFPDARFEVVNTAIVAINSHVVLPIAKDCADHEGDLFVVYLGNNEVVGPCGPGTVFMGFSQSRFAIRAMLWLRSTRFGQLVEHAARALAGRAGPPQEWRGMAMFMENLVAADDPRMETVYDNFRENLADICRVAAGCGAPVILSTVATNLRDCPPFASLHRRDLSEEALESWEKTYDEGKAHEASGRIEVALAKYEAAAEIDDRFAELQFRMARALFALERFEEARRRYGLARDLDALRFRADSRINAVIRKVAADLAGEGVVLADAERAFAESERVPHGIPGEELLFEHVHLNFEGNHLLALCVFDKVRDLLPENVRRNGLAGGAPPDLEACADLVAFTGCNRADLAKQMAKMMSAPPFTNQLDHEERLECVVRRAEALEAYTAPQALEEAVAVYRRAIARDPRDLDFRENLAMIQFHRGAYRDAAEQWRAYLEELPGSPRALHHLGRCMDRMGNLDQAISCYLESLRAEPEAGIHRELADLLAHHGRAEEAEGHYRKALDLKPGSLDLLTALAEHLSVEGKMEEAVRCYRQAAESNPDALQAQLNLGVILLELGRADEARTPLGEALRINPGSAKVHQAVAELEAGENRIDAAVAHYREALALAPEWPVPMNRLARILATCGDPDHRDGEEALRLALKACDLTEHRQPNMLDTLAAAYANEGDFEKAVETAEKAAREAAASGRTRLAAKIRERIKLYRAGKPYREGPAGTDGQGDS